VVIATVFLTIIAMAGGFVLGERQRNDDRTVGGGTSPADQATESPASVFTPPGPFCPDETRATAGRVGLTSEFWQVLKIYTDSSTYWICQDAKGALVYQSRTGGIGTPLVEGKNGLFLQGVRRIGKDSYEVTDQKGNQFVITPDLFELRFADDRRPQRNKARLAG